MELSLFFSFAYEAGGITRFGNNITAITLEGPNGTPMIKPSQIRQAEREMLAFVKTKDPSIEMVSILNWQILAPMDIKATWSPPKEE